MVIFAYIEPTPVVIWVCGAVFGFAAALTIGSLLRLRREER